MAIRREILEAIFRGISDAEAERRVRAVLPEALLQVHCAHCNVVGLRLGEKNADGRTEVICNTCDRKQGES